MSVRRATLFLTIFLIASALLGLAQEAGTYAQIDVPGALGTYSYSIDTAGDIVGYYADDSGTHGFLLSGGTYTTIDYPGATGTQLTGINDMGQIVGLTSSPSQIGFRYDVATQTFTTISYPHAVATYPLSINDAGTIAGYFTYNNGGRVSGFESTGTKYRSIKPPNTTISYVYGISASGELVGDVQSIQQTYINFLFKHGKYHPITIPNAPSAVIFGISPAETALVGYYQPLAGTSVGFLYQDKSTQTLKFPGAIGTAATSINAAGEVVGLFFDVIGARHGFTWTPPVHAEKTRSSDK